MLSFKLFTSKMCLYRSFIKFEKPQKCMHALTVLSSLALHCRLPSYSLHLKEVLLLKCLISLCPVRVGNPLL